MRVMARRPKVKSAGTAETAGAKTVAVKKRALASPAVKKGKGAGAKPALKAVKARKPRAPRKVSAAAADAGALEITRRPLEAASSPSEGRGPSRAKSRPATMRKAKFGVGQVVRHKLYPFRGVVFDIDPVFASTEEWWLSIPAEIRPKKNQPYYHLLAENDETEYIAYVSEQNLKADNSGAPLRHPQLTEFFIDNGDGTYRAVFMSRH